MRDWVDAILAVLLAPLCAACREPLPHPTRGCICDACWRDVRRITPPLCDRCGDPLSASGRVHQWCASCHGTMLSFDSARAIGPHAGTLRSIIHALKYDGRRSIAPALARLMRESGADLLLGADVAVPVPLHPSRRRERGFNQAEDLARHLGLPVCRALRRVRHTDTQAGLHADDRRANVHDAFAATRHVRGLHGGIVVLVDDVRTTGATSDACARVLKAEGVGEVRVLTAARVSTRSD